MTNSKARILGKKALVKIFKSLNIKDGLGDEEIDSNEFSYWNNKSRDGKLGNYIIYEIIDSDVMYRADNKVIAREFKCQIDVFSIHSFESKEFKNLLEKLENKLIDNGFEVSLEHENYEHDTKLYSQVVIITKIYFGG